MDMREFTGTLIPASSGFQGLQEGGPCQSSSSSSFQCPHSYLPKDTGEELGLSLRGDALAKGLPASWLPQPGGSLCRGGTFGTRRALPRLEGMPLFRRLPSHLDGGLILREDPPYGGQLPVSQQLQMSPVPSTGAHLKQNSL